MSNLKNVFRAVSLSLLFFISAQPQLEAREILDVASLAMDTNPATQTVRAEKVALIAERLIQAMNYSDAERTIEIALDLDADNFRAQLLHKMLRLILPFRGFSLRLDPIVQRMSPQDVASYVKSENANRKDPRYRKFALDPRFPPFKNGEDIRKFFRSHIKALDEIILFIQENEHRQISVHSPARSAKPQGNSYFPCDIIQVAPHVYAVETCVAWEEAKPSRITKYDWQAFRLDLIKTKWSMTLLLAYSMDGLDDIVVKLSHTPKNKLTVQKFTRIIQDSANFGKLVDRSDLANLEALGHEATFVVRQLMKEDACKSGEPKRRTGHYFDRTRCFKLEFPFFGPAYQKSLMGPIEAQIEIAKSYVFNGVSQTKTVPYKTQFDMRNATTGQVASLQTLLPSRFDRCGRATGFDDGSLNGFLPRGDWLFISDSFRGIEYNGVLLNSNCVRE